MNTLFEKQGGKYEMQDDYRLACVTLSQNANEQIGVWGNGTAFGRKIRWFTESVPVHHSVRGRVPYTVYGTMQKSPCLL